MATYNQLRYGSQGDDVRTLQMRLNENGSYNLDTDGIFGAKTQAAVKDYQQKNGLAVDGIAGDQTWGALNGAATTTATHNNTGTQAPSTWSYDPFAVSSSTTAADTASQNVAANKPGDFTHGDYAQSAAVTQAQTLLQQQLAQKPGAYTSTWSDQINNTIDKILNREAFSYDVNGDALYQQYKDQYVNQGKLAMMDTMGQAAALTGGYGSSYGQSVGQQAYQAYLQQLNEVVPELYGMALDQHNQEGQALYDQAALMGQMEDQDYGRYRDKLSDYYTELNRLTEDARYKEETDYGRYMDKYNIAYGQHRDKVSDWQAEQDRADSEYWSQYNRDYGQYSDDRSLAYDNYRNQLDMAYQQERDKVADQQWQKEYDFAMQQYLDSKNAGSGGSGGKSYNAGTAELQQKLKAAGYDIAVDGIMGPDTKAALADYNAKLQKGPKPLVYEDEEPEETGNDGYYDQLLGAVSTAKGAYSKQNATVRQQTYKETVAAINDAYNSGRITAAQKQSLMRIATPGTR